jgi:hypothetical protein
MKVQMAQADVILLQEVNPLPEKAEASVTTLKTSGAQSCSTKSSRGAVH